MVAYLRSPAVGPLLRLISLRLLGRFSDALDTRSRLKESSHNDGNEFAAYRQRDLTGQMVWAPVP